LSPYPAAWTTLNGKAVKIYEAEKVENSSIQKPGTIRTDGKTNMEIATADGFLNVKTLQLEGKKKMPISDLLRGFKLEENNFFV
jgi:methionyl-tRNA formyltransferase